MVDTIGRQIRKAHYLFSSRRFLGFYTVNLVNGKRLVHAKLNSDRYSSGEFPYDIEYYLHGHFQSWNSNGQMTCEADYLSGELHGLKRQWDSTGKLVSTEYFKKGVQDSINTYYHNNSCQIKYSVKCKAGNYWADTLEAKEISRNGILTRWYVKDSISYNWSAVNGYSINTWDRSTGQSDCRDFTKHGIIQRHRHYPPNGGSNEFEIRTYYGNGILKKHELYDMENENIVVEIHEYDSSGIFIKTSKKIIEPEYDEVPDEPENTEEVFQWFAVTQNPYPKGGYEGLTQGLNKHLDGVKIKSKFKGVYLIDIEIDLNGEIVKCNMVSPIEEDKNEVLIKTKEYLLQTNWQPYEHRSKPSLTTLRLSVVVK